MRISVKGRGVHRKAEVEWNREYSLKYFSGVRRDNTIHRKYHANPWVQNYYCKMLLTLEATVYFSKVTDVMSIFVSDSSRRDQACCEIVRRPKLRKIKEGHSVL
jgi:hypothetical protein